MGGTLGTSGPEHRRLPASQALAGSDRRAKGRVKRAYAKAKEINPNPGRHPHPEERAILFGQTAQSVERAAR